MMLKMQMLSALLIKLIKNKKKSIQKNVSKNFGSLSAKETWAQSPNPTYSIEDLVLLGRKVLN